MNKFPENFLWGASTSAYQCEGAAHEDGKKSSQQDVINKENHDTYGFADAEIASDHYHHYKEDVALMKAIGMNAYRFSIAWSRIFPDGRGKVNEKGLTFYHNLISELRKNGIEPIVTLYHYDCPMALVEEYGGWLSRKILKDFEYYCRFVVNEFNNEVKYWTTINEQGIIVQFWTQKCYIPKEYRGNDQLRYQINHFMNMAHAIACKTVHELVPGGKVGPSTAFSPIYAKTNRPADAMAALNAYDLRNAYFFDIWFKGEYNTAAFNYLKSRGLAPEIMDGDMDLIKEAKSDFASINYYRSDCAEMCPSTETERFMGVNLSGVKGKIDGYETHPGFYKMCRNDNLDTTEWDWAIDPIGLENSLRDLYTRYKKPMIITENGIGTKDVLTEDHKVHDPYRIDYIKEHLKAVARAMQYGVEVWGYCPWSFMDVLSTRNGYSKRYGLIYVDRTDDDPKECRRYRKDSSYWYEQTIKSRGENLDD